MKMEIKFYYIYKYNEKLFKIEINSFIIINNEYFLQNNS